MGIFRRLRILESDEKDLRDKFYKHSDKIAEKLAYSEIVECEKCGCLLNKYRATKGEGIIRQKIINLYGVKEDYIHYPYYCKIHIPKVKNG